MSEQATKTYQPPPAVQLMRNLGLEPDPWQREVLEGEHSRLLLNCCRQSGKSTVVAVVALVEAIWTPNAKVLLLSRSLRQSTELFRMVTKFLDQIDAPNKGMCRRRTASEVELHNGSRILCLPCSPQTVRGFSRVTLLVLDEAAQVPEDLYHAARPMLAVSRGRLMALSTPFGKRGWFHYAWTRGGKVWHRIELPATQVPRITAEFLEEERQQLGDAVFRREYLCSFEALEGLVYPDFAGRCVVQELPEALRPVDEALCRGDADSPAEFRDKCRRYGGIDFGFRNPFAALWGFTYDGVLYITGEHFARQKPLDYHRAQLPPGVMWYADPSGAGDIDALIRANVKVRKGNNELRLGIAAVTRRLENGTLKVLAGRAANLLAEAELYRYSEDPRDRDPERPLDEHNHALGALRYLLCSLDEKELARRPKITAAEAPPKPEPTLRDYLQDERRWRPTG